VLNSRSEASYYRESKSIKFKSGASGEAPESGSGSVVGIEVQGGGKASAKLKLSRSKSCGFDAYTMWLAPCRTTKRPLGASDLKRAVRRSIQPC
jgi:hypothetical protein